MHSSPPPLRVEQDDVKKMLRTESFSYTQSYDVLLEDNSVEPIFALVDPEEEFLKLGTTTLVPEGRLLDEKWEDWETWEAPAVIQKLFPYYKAGYDNEGSPVYVMEYGKWNYRALGNLAPEEQEAFEKYHEQWIRRVTRDGAANNGQGIVLICDWDGFTMANYASSSALRLVLRISASLRLFGGFVRYGFYINTNFAAESALHAARPFLGDVLEKFEIYGTQSDKWKPVFARRIPPDQLPPQYGGPKDWRPAPY